MADRKELSQQMRHLKERIGEASPSKVSFFRFLLVLIVAGVYLKQEELGYLRTFPLA